MSIFLECKLQYMLWVCHHSEQAVACIAGCPLDYMGLCQIRLNEIIVKKCTSSKYTGCCSNQLCLVTEPLVGICLFRMIHNRMP